MYCHSKQHLSRYMLSLLVFKLSFTTPGTGPGAPPPRARRTQSPAWEPALMADLAESVTQFIKSPILGPFLDRFRIMSGSFWITLRLFWNHLGPLDYFGISRWSLQDECLYSLWLPLTSWCCASIYANDDLSVQHPPILILLLLGIYIHIYIYTHT